MALFQGPVQKDPQEIFNYCTKYLIRDRSNDEDSPNFTEGWRFPLVMTVLNQDKLVGKLNEVTFVYKKNPGENISEVFIKGSFLPFYQSLSLEPVLFDGSASDLFSLTILLPVGKGFYYRYIVDGVERPDRINPQKKILENGKEWSFFFTDYYNYSNDFEEWEMNLMHRLVNQIVPLRSEEAQNFINRFYEGLPRGEKDALPIYRLDESVGEVNYITNILAKAERHHLIDYKICLKLIDTVLRMRNPFVNSWMVSEQMINDLYNEMAANNVAGWDTQQYQEPAHFLRLIRRHAIVGAFCHPRYGGNIGGAGWNYLKDKYAIKDETGRITRTYFNWPLAIEKPHGENVDYWG